MALLLGGTAFLLMLGVFVWASSSARRLSNQLSQQDEAFSVWMTQEHLALDRFRPALKKWVLGLMGLLWLLGVVVSAIHESLAYTILVAALGWAPAAALGFAALAPITLLLKLVLAVNFMSQWLVKSKEARLRVQASRSVEQ